MKIHPYTLRFPGHEEGAYLDYYHEKSIRQMRVALILVLTLWSAAAIKDGWIAPGEQSRLSFIRFAVFPPVLIGTVLFSFSPLFKRYGQFCLSLVLFWGAVCIIAMNAVAPAPGNYLYPAGLTIFLMSPSFLKLRFPYAFIESWLAIVCYDIVAPGLIHVPLPLLINNNVYFVAANVISLFTCYLLELHSRKDYLQQGAQRLAAAVFTNTTDGIVITDADGTIQSVNEAFVQITGYTAAEVVGQTPRILKSGLQKAEFYNAMWKTVKETGTWKGRFWNRRKNGEIYPQESTINAIKNDRGEIVQYCGILRDVTDQHRLEEMLQKLSSTDGLTGLSNRRSFNEAIKEEWRRAQRLRYPLALIMADIDHFKEFNDTYGHVEGDECLKKIGMTLKNAIRRAGDLAARYGGEEFVLLMPMTDADEILEIAETIRKNVEALGIPHKSSLTSDHVTISMGAVSAVPRQDISVEELITAADRNLYEVKRSGRNRVLRSEV